MEKVMGKETFPIKKKKNHRKQFPLDTKDKIGGVHVHRKLYSK
jgi:hypothetical protein